MPQVLNLGNNLNSNSLDNKRQRWWSTKFDICLLPTNLTVPHSTLIVVGPHCSEYGDDVQSSSSVETCVYTKFDICLYLTVPYSTLIVVGPQH